MEVDDALREELYNHGMALNPNYDSVQCNYCGTVVSGFDCLHLHLGGDRGVKGKHTGCQNVPFHVKQLLRSKVANSKVVSRKRGNSETPEPKDLKSESSVKRSSSTASASTLNDEAAALFSRFSGGENHKSSSVMIKKWIGRYLIDNAIDFDAAKSDSFKKMIEAVSNASDVNSYIPSIQELKGWIFSDELKDIKSYVNGRRDSWEKNGCSIVLDGWVDERGQNHLIVVVDCPLGAVYIDSFDVSNLMGDVDGFLNILEGVIMEVGVQNIVQVIFHTSSNFMDTVGKRLIESHRSLFWSVSATHCVALMLEKIVMANSVKQVLDKAKAVTKFIYSHEDLLKLMRCHTDCFDLVKPFKIKAAVPFLTLENILFQQENLKKLVLSSEWIRSSRASNAKGKRVAEILLDKKFWDRISVVVRATIPLVKVLNLLNGDGDPHVGFIYETMDQVKETISEELELDKALYGPYWKIIDDVWNNILHIPLHAAGYFLNPRFLYDEDVCADSEVAGGLLATIVKMVPDIRTQDIITKQLDVYQSCQGDFKRGTENDAQNTISPVAWWTTFGSQCPELQKLAIRILSQTCNGAESYGLKKGLAEKLLSSKGRSFAEQQHLRSLAYIHYNTKLKQNLESSYDDGEAEVDSCGDWIMDEEELSKDVGLRNCNLSGVGRNAAGQGGTSYRPKAES